MKRSQRGAAKISVIWAVALLVAFLIALTMFFLGNQEYSATQEEIVKRDARIKTLEAQSQERAEKIAAISKVFGFADETAAMAITDLPTATEALKGLQKSIPELDTGAKNYQAVLPTIVTIYNAKKTRIEELETKLGEISAEKDKVAALVRDTGDAAEKEKADLRRQVTDSETRFNDTKSELDRQVNEAKENFKDRDSKYRAAQAQIEDLNRSFEQERGTLRSRMDEQGRKLNPFVKEPERPDAKILAVSKDTGLGWIDIGNKQRLTAGIKFTVVSGSHATTKDSDKAWAEVTNVQGDMAEVRFYNQRDPFDPPTVGDVLYNPLFDPRGERSAVLIGRFSGLNMSEKEVQALLTGMGITVQKSVDKSTDFLIVGGEMYQDANGQPLTEPIQPADLPAFKDATALGVQVVLLKDLRQYFRF